MIHEELVFNYIKQTDYIGDVPTRKRSCKLNREQEEEQKRGKKYRLLVQLRLYTVRFANNINMLNRIQTGTGLVALVQRYRAGVYKYKHILAAV